MEPFTIVLAFYLVMASGTLTWWLAPTDASMRTLQEDMTEDRLSMEHTLDS